jgi:hypothetical protein
MVHNPPDPDVHELLNRLHAAGNADGRHPANLASIWTDATQLQDVMLVSPDRLFAYLYRIPSPPFPSSASHSSYYSCNLYVRDVEACRTLAACLECFGIVHDQYARWQPLSPSGEPVDLATAPVQTVCLVSRQ